MYKKNVDGYLEKLMEENFDWMDFSPDNNMDVKSKFKKIFYSNHPYWKEREDDENSFCIEFKKYSDKNDEDEERRILLKFSFSSTSRTITLALFNEFDEKLNNIDQFRDRVNMCEIWLDHEVFTFNLRKYVKKGLDLAEE